MLVLLLLPLLWTGSLQEDSGYELAVPDSVTVQAGLCALVPCTFSYPGSGSYYYGQPYIYWFRGTGFPYYQGLVATNNPDRQVSGTRFHLLGKIRAGDCSLSIQEARREDTGRYSFRVEGGRDVKYTYKEKKLNLHVTDPTWKPDIHFLEPLKSGHPTSLSCSLPGSCEGGQPPTFSWMGGVLNSMDPRTLHSSGLILTPRPQDHNTNLTCQVKLQGAQVTTERTVQLNVSYAPQNVSISLCFPNGTVLKILPNASCLPLLEGQAPLLCCASDGNPPARLSWLQGSRILNASSVSNIEVLALPPVGPAEGGFTCRAENEQGSQTASVSLSLLYSPQLLGPTCSWGAEGLHCSCSSRAQPAPSLGWRLGERMLVGNSSNASVTITITSSSTQPWANSSLGLRGALSSSLKLSCEAWNVHGAQSAAILLLPGKSASGAGFSQIPAALGGAGTMALLSLCLCLAFFCIVKVRRQRAAGRPEAMKDEDPIMGSVTWGSRKEPWPDSPRDQVSPAGDAPPLKKQEELHYASLSFHRMKLQDFQDREARSSTNYSEIKTSK